MTSLSHTETLERIAADIEAVKQIAIVPTILDVICSTTGMRFSAVARVTEDRWIACSVHDELSLGLRPGGELKVEATICNEIRDSRKPVIIDNVAEDKNYAQHLGLKMYGFQSYISFPLILKTGEFFGTLCAIDYKPAQLNNAKVIGMFSLFSEILIFHLQNIDLIEQSRRALLESSRQIKLSQNEDR
jgi:GAF domain-containing protein